MFSNFSKNGIFLLLLTTLTLSSCSWWGGSEENENRVNVVTITNDNFESECLSEIDDFFIKYFRGLTTRLDINDSIDCVSGSMNMLFKNAQERDSEKGFTRRELVNILSTVWAQKEKEEIEKNVEIIFLSKRLIIGGNKDGFSRSDLKRFNKILPEIKSIVLNSNVNIKYWFFDRYDDRKTKEEAFDIVGKNMAKFDSLRVSSASEFSREEALKLLKIIFSSKGLEKFSNLIFIGYDIVFGDSKAFSHSQKEIFKRVNDSFEALSTLRSARFSRGLFKGQGLSLLFDGMHKAVSLLSSWSESDENFSIPTYQFNLLISEAYRYSGDRREEHPLGLTITRFLEKFLNTKNLKKSSFDKFLNSLLAWYAGQREIVNNYNPENSEFSFDKYELNQQNLREALAVLDSVRKTERSYFVLNQDGTSQYVFNRESRDTLSNEDQYYDLSLKNLLAHGAFRAYETYVNRDALIKLNDLNASKEQLTELLLDIRPLALDMGITDPYSCKAADNFMMEANLFTNAGNGDKALSFIEGIELVYMSVSAGALSHKVYESIDKSCELEGMSYLGNAFMSRACVKKEIFGKHNTLFSNFEEFDTYYGIIENPTSRKNFYPRLGFTGAGWVIEFKETNPDNLHELVFEIVNGCPNRDTPITKQDIQTMVGLTQYIENWFSIYDNTGQGFFLKRTWWDEDHFDYVLDGAEVRELFDDRLSEIYEDAFNFETWDSKIANTFKQVTNLYIGGLDLDRYRALAFLHEVRKKLKEGSHNYRNLFCGEIVKAIQDKKPIAYNDKLILKCDGSDNDALNMLPKSNR